MAAVGTVRQNPRSRSISILLALEVYEELTSQARQFGYRPNTVTIYCADRLTQLADHLLLAKLPVPIPSWPPPRECGAQPERRRWFLRDDNHVTRTRRGRRR